MKKCIQVTSEKNEVLNPCWEKKQLGELTSIQYGKSPQDIIDKNGSYPLLGTGGITGYGNRALYQGESIIIGRKGTINKPIYFNGAFWVIDTAYFTTDFQDCNVKWLYYYLVNSVNFQKYNESTGVPSLNRSTIEKISILVPPLNQQEKINEILTTIDIAINKTEQIVEKHKNIKQGLMQDLLTRGVQPDGKLRPKYENEAPELYKETELGVLPIDWDVDYLENLLEKLIDYRGKTPNKTNSGIPLITAKNVRFGYICEEPKEYISEYDYDSWMTRGFPKVGDVLFTTEAPLANVSQITDEKIALAQRVVTLRTNERLINTLLKYILMTEQARKQIFSRSSGTTALGIKQSLLRKILIPFPKEIGEQMKIIDILETYDRKIEKEELNIRKLSKIKEGLMQDLLNGKVRVKVEGDGDE